MKIKFRVAETARFGPVRVRLSEPAGKGQSWLSAGVPTWLGWLSVSGPAGGRKPRRRS